MNKLPFLWIKIISGFFYIDNLYNPIKIMQKFPKF